MADNPLDEEIGHATTLGKKLKLSRKAAPKNKTAAPIQITAEQLLREAKEREMETMPPPPTQGIQDQDELDDYLRRKRQEFENIIRKNRTTMTAYFKYAAWEDNRGNIDRARSIYERALDMNHRDVQLWLRYAEMEQKNKQVQHARNIFDRAVTILPRANQFWYKYVHMEEILSNHSGCRAVFERWMEWEPDEQAWASYVNFETRYQETERVRGVYERFIICHPTWKNWQKYAKFEERQSLVENARHIYERAIEFFSAGADEDEEAQVLDSNLLISFAQFEERQKEHERARVIYKYGLDTLLKNATTEDEKNRLATEDPKVKLLLDAYTRFEKQYGSRAKIESQITAKRKAEYENRVTKNNHDYDAWFDYVKLLENQLPKNEDLLDLVEDELEHVRDVFERAIKNIPPAEEKRYWRRYIYLWINYCVFEELTAKDIERARKVYDACIQLIPHHIFTFAKVWIMYAHFEIRQKNLSKSRKIFGMALGKCPKGRLFKAYIEMETELREFDRVRTLYKKYIIFNSENCQTWIRFAELETMLGDIDRARGVYTLGINRDKLDMPEVLWKSYIDFEVSCDEWDKARTLYKRLLKKTNHIKVWTALCQFEYTAHPKKKRYIRTTVTFKEAAEAMRLLYKQSKNDLASTKIREESTEDDIVEADSVLKQALENRITILDSWKTFETEHGKEDSEAKRELKKHLPKRIKKRKRVNVTTEGGRDSSQWEEFWDYIFPEEEEQKSSLKLLQMAKMWKMQKSKASKITGTKVASEIEGTSILVSTDFKEAVGNKIAVTTSGGSESANDTKKEADENPKPDNNFDSNDNDENNYVPSDKPKEGEIDISDED